MMSMKQHVLAKALFCGFLMFSGSIVSLAANRSAQGGIFSGQPGSSQDASQNQNGSSQTSDPAFHQPGQSNNGAAITLPGAPVLTSPRLDQNQNQGNEQNTRRGIVIQPPPLSDFQRLVAASIGKVLPIYGAKLFVNAPTTFAPVNRIPVTPNYVIGPGDELLIQMWGQVTLDGHYTVDRSGSIYIPQVGTVHVAGLPFEKLTDFLRSQVGRVFQNFDLNVNLGQLRSIQIFVVGEAAQPGSYTVSSLSTLVNAIFASGGPSPAGSMRDIQVRRGKDVVATFDLYDLLIRGDKSKDVPLSSGDVIYFAPVGRMVALAGSIDKPALYELKNETTLKDVIELSGGLSTLARQKDVRIERVRQHDDTRSILDINLDQAGFATPLADGDILEIFPIIDRFKDAVTLRGNVANPKRFAWFPGMRVHDLIPDKEALLTRDYWERRNQLGLPVLDSTADVRRDAPEGSLDNDTNVYKKGTAKSGSQDKSAQDKADQDKGETGNSSSNANSKSAQTGDAELGSGGLLSAQDTAADQSGDKTSGSSVSALVTGGTRRFPIKNGVVLSAPEIDWAYAVIQRQDKKDLSSKLLPFNLGKVVLDGDAAENLELEPGDVITIFSNADIRVPQDQQTKFVRLEGEFVASGVYRVMPGETLRQLVARAHGLTKKAYLYGSEFTRESAKVIEQQRINAYANDLDQRIKLAEANSANNALNPQDEMADVAALHSARVVATNLHQAKATGRIVLSMKPDASSVQDIPEFALEDGDTFVVPQTPLSVGVFGSVYTQNQYLYDIRKRAKDYIHMAGGGTRTADTGRSYIVRADGSIVSRQFSTALFTGNFDATHIYPGDAVVIPEQVNKRPLLRNLVDIATIIGQFGLGIAAINVLQ